MIEAVKSAPIQGKQVEISQKQGADLLFEQFDIQLLQNSICIHFYFNEFMENTRTIFQEQAKNQSLNIHEQCDLYRIYSSVNNLIQRLK